MKASEERALLERAIAMMEHWKKGVPPKDAAYHFFMADYRDFVDRQRKETEQMRLWNGERRNG